MKKMDSILLVLAAASCLLLVPTDEAAAQAKPFQLSLWYPVQIHPLETPIHGLRINLVYGYNRDVLGADLGLVNRAETTTGYQTGLLGWTEGSFTGWQDNFVNLTGGKLTGVQSGLFNQAGDAEGALLGWINFTESMNGFQLGLFNYTRHLHGLQVGLLNIAQDKEKLPVLPIVNWCF